MDMSALGLAGDELDDAVDVAGYTTREAATLCGLPYNTLDRLARAGAITSTVPAAGYGSRRLWSPLEVERLQRIADVYFTAEDAGVMLTWDAIAQMWQTLTAGKRWELHLAA